MLSYGSHIGLRHSMVWLLDAMSVEIAMFIILRDDANVLMIVDEFVYVQNIRMRNQLKYLQLIMNSIMKVLISLDGIFPKELESTFSQCFPMLTKSNDCPITFLFCNYFSDFVVILYICHPLVRGQLDCWVLVPEACLHSCYTSKTCLRIDLFWNIILIIIFFEQFFTSVHKFKH